MSDQTLYAVEAEGSQHRRQAPGALSTHTATAAAQTLDLQRFRQMVYVGGDGEVLAAFMEGWRQLAGVWLGPVAGQAAASRFLGHRGLAGRMHYVAGEALADLAAPDLVLLSAIDAGVDQSLELLTSAGAGWLPPEGRWLILQRHSPHLSCVISPALLRAQGLRVASQWPLPGDAQLLVCAPAHRFAEALAQQTAAWSPAP